MPRKMEELMAKNKRKCFFLPLLIACMSVYGKSYKILPSIAVEYKDDRFGEFNGDDLQNIKNKCKYLVEIKGSILSIYCFSDEEFSNREDNEIIPEKYFINFKESFLEERFYFYGNNKNGKFVKGYIDDINKDGSFCIYDTNGIELYLAFEYAITIN